MDLQADIQWIKNELSHVSDPKLIEAFKNLLQYRKSKLDKDYSIAIEQYNKDLQVSEKEIEEGAYYSHDQVQKIASQWGNKTRWPLDSYQENFMIKFKRTE